MNENLMSLVSNFVPTKNLPLKMNDAIKPLNGMMPENFEIAFGDLLSLGNVNDAIEDVASFAKNQHALNDAISFDNVVSYGDVGQVEFESINNFGSVGGNISMENLLVSSEVPKLTQSDGQIISHIDVLNKYEVSQNIMQRSGEIISADDLEVAENAFDGERDVNFANDASEEIVGQKQINLDGEVNADLSDGGEENIAGHGPQRIVSEKTEIENDSFEVAPKGDYVEKDVMNVTQANENVKITANSTGKNLKIEPTKDFKIANGNSKNGNQQNFDNVKEGKIASNAEKQFVIDEGESSKGQNFSDGTEDGENFEISDTGKSSNSHEASKKGGFEKILSGNDGQNSKVKISENADIVKQNAEHMKVQIERAAKNGDEKMTIQLKPIELGKIDITIERVGNNIQNISIASEKIETMEMLQKDASQLMKLFGENRQNADLNFSMMNQEQQQHSGEFEQVAPNLDEVVTENLIASYEREGLNIVI